MIIFCHDCQTNFSLDDKHVPAQTFSVRCPKCERVITAEPDKSFVPKPLANKVQIADKVVDKAQTVDKAQVNQVPSNQLAASGEVEALRLLLASLLGQPIDERGNLAAHGSSSSSIGAAGAIKAFNVLNQSDGSNLSMLKAGQRNGALVCVAERRAARVEELLFKRGYQVFVAEDAASAVTYMREERIGSLILDAEFSAAEDGAAYVRRMLNQMQLNERRRVFVVGLSTDVRTMDAHAAFVQSFNMVINTEELDSLPDALERTKRAFDELYFEYDRI